MPTIGIDFDNTMVCYDEVFHSVACDRGLIPVETPPAKQVIRDHLRAAGREDDWTELQALVYGLYIREAPPFPGLTEFLTECADRDIAVAVISHKTKKPYQGPPLDLRSAALDWLSTHSFLAPADHGVSRESIYFEDTKRDKLRRIEQVACDLFVDDLLEFLSDPDFPTDVRRVHFDPSLSTTRPPEIAACGDWYQASEHLSDWLAE